MRWEALDELRGFSLLLLITLVPLSLFTSVPGWLKHSSGDGFRILDLLVPLFLFALGLSYRISLLRRLREYHFKHTLYFFIRRYFIFIIFGLLGELVKYREFRLHWGVLEMVGLAGIFAFPAMFLSCRWRISLALASLTTWQILLHAGYSTTALEYDLGGPVATLAWMSIVLCASVLYEVRIFYTKLKYILLLVAVAIGLYFITEISSSFIPINKHLVTFSYIALSIQLSVISLIFFILKEKIGIPFKIFSMLGKNALVIYVFSGIEIVIIESIFSPFAPLVTALLIAGSASAMCVVIGWLLNRKKIYLKV